MPNRIIRESILSSEAVCFLKWEEEVFYRRLLSVVDDYGRYEANPRLLRSKCYPIQVDKVREADITRWMAACHAAGLIVLYKVDAKVYLEVVKFGQRTRSPSKFPAAPSSADKCAQMPANDGLDVVVSVVEDVDGQDESVDKLYAAYPRKKAPRAAKKAIAAALKRADFMVIMAGLERYCAEVAGKDPQYIKHPSTWFNQDCWADEPDKPAGDWQHKPGAEFAHLIREEGDDDAV